MVDTTGCGDTYHGAFLFGLASGWPLRECARLASRVAAENCRFLGGAAFLNLARRRPCRTDLALRGDNVTQVKHAKATMVRPRENGAGVCERHTGGRKSCHPTRVAM